MFKEIKKKWEISKKEKADKIIYLKELHNAICNLKDMAGILETSKAMKLEISKEGICILVKARDRDIRMYINEEDYEEVPMSILCFGDYEKVETDMVLSVLSCLQKENITIFDIGANVGWYTLNILNRFGKQTAVYAFEPSPITYNRLVNNLALNDADVTHAVNIGFYKESGVMEFYYDQEGSGASSLVNLRNKEEIKTIDVNMYSMDEWVEKKEIKEIDFIKCDVEGSELFVYEGGKETIKKYLPIIFSEMLRKWSAKFGYHPNDIIKFLSDLGYACYVISDNVYLKEIFIVDENTVETNYFFLHREKHADLINKLTK